MKKERILVATDLAEVSSRALAKAIYLAQSLDCHLDILHIVEFSIFHNNKKERKLGKDALDKFLAQHYPELKNLSVKVEAFCRVGEVHEEIANFAKERMVKLVCIGFAGENHSLSEVLLGTNTKKIIRKCPVPVLVIKNDQMADYHQIFLPTDFSEPALKLAHFVSSVFTQAHYIFYHLVKQPLSVRLQYYGLDANQLAQYTHKQEEKAQDKAKSFLKDLEKLSKEHHKQIKQQSKMMLDTGTLSTARLMAMAAGENVSLIALPTSGKISFFALDVVESSNLDVLVWKL